MRNLLLRLLDLPGERTQVARDVDSLHFFVILTTMAGAAFIAIAALYFMIRWHRRVPDEDARPLADARWRPPLWLEGGIIVSIFGLFLVWWLIGASQFVRIRVPPEHAENVYVTAKQWMWEFAYAAGRTSQTTLYVPAGRDVRLVMTSRDVIHSFYVPAFRVKQDVIPGRYTTLWFHADAPGRYPIFCAEFCGTGHSRMLGEVFVLAPEDYEAWIGAAAIDLAKRGHEVAAAKGCLSCHSTDGTPHLGPTWAGLYGSRVPLEGGGTAVVDEAYITESMMDPLVKVHLGYTRIMPTFLGRITPAETAAIIEYLRALRDTTPATLQAPLMGQPHRPEERP